MGKPIGHTDDNGTNRTCLYDETGRLSGITQGPIAVTYSYDAQGQVSCIAVTDSQTGLSMVTDLAYDEFGREILRRSRSEEHTSELQSLMRISYAVFCLKK